MTKDEREQIAQAFEDRANDLRNEQHRRERERGMFSMCGSKHKAEEGLYEAARMIREWPTDADAPAPAPFPGVSS